MAWIELHQAVWTHRKTLVLAAELDLPETYAASHVIRLWCWALDNTPEGDLTGLPEKVLAFGADWRGDPTMFVAALIRAGWVDAYADGGRYLHDWRKYRHYRYSRTEPNPVRRAWDAMARRIRPLVFARDGYRCVYCGATEPLEADHVIPIARGGANDLTNLQTLCKPCNRAKGDR